jgi:transcriptional regulator with XRE-family HTH domain
LLPGSSENRVPAPAASTITAIRARARAIAAPYTGEARAKSGQSTAGDHHAMPTMERARDRGRLVAADLLGGIARELRTTRRGAGVSQRRLARVAGLTQSGVSRTERGVRTSLTLEELAVHASALGLRVSVKLYPVGSRIRDEPQLRLLAHLRTLVHPVFRWLAEAPVGGQGDLRAWDVRLTGPVTIGIDAETRLLDIQALQRRVELKRRDSGVDRVVLVLADTKHNHRVVREFRAALLPSFPLGTRDLVESLRSGRDPGGDGIMFVAPRPRPTGGGGRPGDAAAD